MFQNKWNKWIKKEIAILVSNRLDVKSPHVRGNEEAHFTLIKGISHKRKSSF